MTAEMYVGLLHYPVYNSHMEVIAGAVTNFDIHDIARVCRIYDVKRYYIIHLPLIARKSLLKRFYDSDGRDMDTDTILIVLKH